MRILELTKCMIAIMLMAWLPIGLSSCQSDDEPNGNDIDLALQYDDSWLQPIDLTESNAAAANDFFTKLLDSHKPMDMVYNGIVYLGDKYYGGHINCLVINNEDELKAAFPSEASRVPTIDFSDYTLVFGCVWESTTTWIDAENIRVKESDEGIRIRIPIYIGWVDLCDGIPHFFLNLYPKFVSHNISIDKVVMKSREDGSTYFVGVLPAE